MHGFYYYFPGLPAAELARGNEVNRDTLRSRGLIDILDDVREIPSHAIATDSPKGPDGAGGSILYVKPKTGDLPKVAGYHSADQQWIPDSEESTKFFLGWWRDEPPTPIALERHNANLNTWWAIEDGGGRKWKVPSVRGHSHTPNPYGSLESTYQFCGSVKLVVRREYQQLWERSAKVWDHIEGRGERLSENELACYAAEVLSLIYRIGPTELRALHEANAPLITTGNLLAILLAICDYDAVKEFEAAQKKTECRREFAGVDFLAGTMDETQSGSQPAVSSI